MLGAKEEKLGHWSMLKRTSKLNFMAQLVQEKACGRLVLDILEAMRWLHDFKRGMAMSLD